MVWQVNYSHFPDNNFPVWFFPDETVSRKGDFRMVSLMVVDAKVYLSGTYMQIKTL